VTNGDGNKMRLWDAVDGNLIRSIDAGNGPIRDFAFSPDSKLLVEGDIRVDFGIPLFFVPCPLYLLPFLYLIHPPPADRGGPAMIAGADELGMFRIQ
jgi:hypothetical protein